MDNNQWNGQQPYQQPYGQPMYGQPAAAPKKSKTGLIVGSIIGGVAVIAAIIVLIFVLKGKGGYTTRECEACEETKKCKEYVLSYEGQTENGWLCDDCYKEAKSFIELMGGTLKEK